MKAYTTRVGEGPFPTELLDADGEKLRTDGARLGTTTGRNRRCGWFDALVVEAAVTANAFTDIFLTKLDILTGWEKIPVCIAYEVNGERTDVLPMTQTDFHHAVPVYEYLDGWTENIWAVARSTSSRRTPRPTSTSWRNWCSTPFPASASARPANRWSCSTTCCGVTSSRPRRLQAPTPWWVPILLSFLGLTACSFTVAYLSWVQVGGRTGSASSWSP